MLTITVFTGYLQLLVLTGFGVQSGAAVVTCVAGRVVAGDTAYITCNFRTNLPDTKRSINVEVYPLDAPKGTTGSGVLLCDWQQGKYDCFVEPGYTFDNVITSRLTVQVPVASKKFAGMYMCFFVPQNGTTAHPCELSVQAKQLHNDTDVSPQTDETSNFLMIAVIGVGVLAVIAIIVCAVVCILQRHRKKKNRENVEETVAFIKPHSNQIKQRLKQFKLTTQTLKVMMDKLDQEMKKGLNESTRAEADVKMYPVYCPIPDTSGIGDYLMVDFGSTCVKVSVIQLRKYSTKIPSASYPLDRAMKEAITGEQIFDFIVSAISRFVKEQNMSAKQLKSVLVVHFPCHHKTIDKASIAKWTKEFTCGGVDQDLNELLQKSIRKKTDLKLKVVAIVNSAVNALMSAVCHNPRCMISFVGGNGFNACYVDKHQKEDTDGAEDKVSYEIYNTELGALGENGSLDLLRSAYDKELDNASKKPGCQILEKMASWMYIGEIVRLALVDLRTNELVLTDAPAIGGIFEKGVFTANHVANIDKDTSENYGETADILNKLGVLNPTKEDLKTVKYTCRLVTDRAASLAAASLATLINRLNQPDIVIVVDGELYRQIPRFQDVMYSKTQELVKPALKEKFYLASTFSKGCTGAVRMAIAELSKQNAAEHC